MSLDLSPLSEAGKWLAGASGAKAFLGKVFGPATDQFAGILSDEVAGWRKELGVRRERRLLRISIRASEHLDNAGVEPVGIPDYIAVPLLEGATLVDDNDLQATWAALLANAADPRGVVPVEPSFPAILKELSSREVHFLDALTKETNGAPDLVFSKRELLNVYVAARLADSSYVLPKQFDFAIQETPPPPQFRLMLNVLQRQQILIVQDGFENIHASTIRDSITSDDGSSINIPRYAEYVITELGRLFRRACQAPPRD